MTSPPAGQGCHKAASCTMLYNIYTRARRRIILRLRPFGGALRPCAAAGTGNRRLSGLVNGSGGRCGRGFGGALPALAGMLHTLYAVGATEAGGVVLGAGHLKCMAGACG